MLYFVSKTEIEELEGTTGLIITPETKEYAGFMAPQRQTVEISGEGNLVVKYYYTRNTNTSYKVKHWVQKLEGMPNSHDDHFAHINIGLLLLHFLFLLLCLRLLNNYFLCSNSLFLLFHFLLLLCFEYMVLWILHIL